MTADTTSLVELLDKQAITEILYLYARGWDRLDEDALRHCFHADSTHKHSGFEGLSHDFIAFGLKACADVLAMTHLVTNPLIVVRGDAAVSECSYLAHHRRKSSDRAAGEEDMFIKGRFIDRFEKRHGNWKIARREGYFDFERIVAPADRTLSAADPDQFGRYKPDDALYHILADF